ncbi:MAG TPA: hypothetical protein IGS53_12460 [Leptolyngbyaceae cyanobacterium M33_DOE_097]|uniref:Uncharacterized protein n=1 Tax=Oscillatoriales cyanobacterium SpSt-418 TaxID=2282169 RepID=A0A7C3PJV7_9CYAN|nr:hypothetical protein [Leptolyngbyaceae cyanobacterium M33_DOE_097]
MSDEVTVQENGVEPSSKPVKIETKPSETKAEAPAPKGALQLRQPTSMIMNRPVMPSELEVTSTMTVAGVRPVIASHLDLVGSFLNGRPISASHLVVKELLPGGRPVFASELVLADDGMLPGNRPIMASDPLLMHSSTLPGNRPIAPNDIDDPEPSALMGYLD